MRSCKSISYASIYFASSLWHGNSHPQLSWLRLLCMHFGGSGRKVPLIIQAEGTTSLALREFFFIHWVLRPGSALNNLNSRFPKSACNHGHDLSQARWGLHNNTPSCVLSCILKKKKLKMKIPALKIVALLLAWTLTYGTHKSIRIVDLAASPAITLSC